MPRLFIGLALPETVRAALSALKSPIPGARWIEPENYHITLRFIGDIDNPDARELDDTLSRIRIPGFEIRLTGLGVFGGNDPRSLWAGVETNPALEELAAACERAARRAGCAPERRSFRPHVTLARLKYPRIDALARYLQRAGGFRTPAFDVEQFSLFSAKPRTGGGPYVIEQNYDLITYNWTEADDNAVNTNMHGA